MAQPESRMQEVMSELAKYQISKFFLNNTPVTQEQCDSEAARIAGASGTPTAVQGGCSYTVIAGDYAIRFRAPDSALDIDLLRGVEKAYAGFTPHHENVGKFGELHVYRMNNIGGSSMYLARDRLNHDDYRLLKRTLKDYARSVGLSI